MSSLFLCLFHTRYNSQILRTFYTQFIISCKFMAIALSVNTQHSNGIYSLLYCAQCLHTIKWLSHPSSGSSLFWLSLVWLTNKKNVHSNFLTNTQSLVDATYNTTSTCQNTQQMVQRKKLLSIFVALFWLCYPSSFDGVNCKQFLHCALCSKVTLYTIYIFIFLHSFSRRLRRISLI